MLLPHYALEIRNGNTKDLDGAWCLYIDGVSSLKPGLSNFSSNMGLNLMIIDFNSNRTVMVGLIQSRHGLFYPTLFFFFFRCTKRFSYISDSNVNIIF